MLPLIRVEEYVTEEGKSPFAEWFNGLDAQAAAKVNTYLTRIEQGGTKKGQQKDIDTAWEFWQDYKKRKRGKSDAHFT